MKIFFYNVLDGCRGQRFDNLIAFINKHDPDILGLSELNGWDEGDMVVLNSFMDKTGFKYYVFCEARTGYHLELFSRHALKDKQVLHEGMWHGAITAQVNDVRLIVTHLCPKSENLRLKEIETLKPLLTGNALLMGDLNALSSDDAYDTASLLRTMKAHNISKFGTDTIHFDVTRTLGSIGLYDSFALCNDCPAYSVPTHINDDKDHFARLRLDYMFISKSLKARVSGTGIMHDAATEAISDHYPVFCELED